MPASDPRYPPALTWDFLWTATFQSSKFLDGYNGGFGFHYLLLLPAAVKLLRSSPWLARVCLLVGLTGGAAILAQMGYLRYILPALALLCAAFAFAIERVGRLPIVVVALLNVYFFPAASSYTNDFWLPRARESYLRQAAPIRILVDRLNHEARGEPVAFLEDDQVAGLVGKPFAVSWRTWQFHQALGAAASPGTALQVFASRGIRRAIAPAPSAWYASQHASAQGLLQVCGELTSQAGDFGAWRIGDACTTAEQVDRLYFENAPVAPPGEYDDVSPFPRYRGHWLHDRQFGEAAGHTLTYSSTAGDFVQLGFRGRRVRFLYTAAPNRGVGDVSIDGRSVGRLDQHSLQTGWQREAVFEAAAPGEHVLRVSLSPGKPGAYLDVDRMVVE